MTTPNEESPTMRQYHRAKAECPPGTILFFRIGDFYEMFEADALEAAPLLGLTLTRRNGVPMCGVPYHAAERYASQLIRAGKPVALCDQMEDPRNARGIPRREITAILTEEP